MYVFLFRLEDVVRDPRHQNTFLDMDRIIGQAIHQLAHLLYDSHDNTFNDIVSSLYATYQERNGPLTFDAIENEKGLFGFGTSRKGSIDDYKKFCFMDPKLRDHIVNINKASGYTDLNRYGPLCVFICRKINVPSQSYSQAPVDTSEYFAFYCS